MADGQTVVANAVEVEVSAEGVEGLMHKAATKRSVSATNMNAQSSRSHAVFRLRLEGVRTAADGTQQNLSGALNLIDLAGSERLDSSGATGARLKETQAINKSLSALGARHCAVATAATG
jgi:kinesin family protein C1